MIKIKSGSYTPKEFTNYKQTQNSTFTLRKQNSIRCQYVPDSKCSMWYALDQITSTVKEFMLS